MPLRKDVAIALLQSAEKQGNQYIIAVPIGDKGQIIETRRMTITGKRGTRKLPQSLYLENAPTILDHLAQAHGIKLDPKSEDARNLYYSGDSIENCVPILGAMLDNLLDPARKTTCYSIENIKAVEAAAGMSWERAQARKPASGRPAGEKEI